MSYASLAGRDPGRPALDQATVATVEVEVKYRGYIDRAARRLAAVDALDETEIPSGFPFTELAGLSAEVREKLLRHQPRTWARPDGSAGDAGGGGFPRRSRPSGGACLWMICGRISEAHLEVGFIGPDDVPRGTPGVDSSWIGRKS